MLGIQTVSKIVVELGLRYAEMGMRHDPEAKRIVGLLRDGDLRTRTNGLNALDRSGIPLDKFLPRLTSIVIGGYNGGPYADDDIALATEMLGKSGLVGLRMLLRQLSPGKDAECAGAAFRAFQSIVSEREISMRVGRDGLAQLGEQAERYAKRFGLSVRAAFEGTGFSNRCRVAEYLRCVRELLIQIDSSLAVSGITD